MPSINPSLVPTINPGSLFSRFTSDTNLSIRYFVNIDPVAAPVLNRPLGDIVLRQLILAKTVDALNLRLGHQALFPYLVQPQVNNGTSNIDVPLSWIWDMNISIPKKWERVRLAKLRRISGTNPASTDDSYTGIIRLIFTAQEQGSTTEVPLFQVDYQIDSNLTYQEGQRVSVPTTESPALPASETETIGGFITFKTLDNTNADVQSFLDTIEPPADTTAVDSNGLYLSPITVEINDSPAGSADITGDFEFTAVSHGTGLLTLNAWNPIPSLDSDVNTWLQTFNYPFDTEATLTSSNSTGVVIPSGLFREFNILAPDNDKPTGDESGDNYPVYINRIVREDTGSDTLKFYFATYNVETSSIVPIELSTLTLTRTATPNTKLAIEPLENLFPEQAGNALWMQGFGKGYVVLSDLWGGTTSEVSDFFDSFLPIIDEPPQAVFTEESTRISTFGVNRLSRNTPTNGQAEALKGSKDGANEPSSSNRYVVEADQGLGTQIDFGTSTQLDDDIRDNDDIERYGWTGSICHRLVKLVVDAGGSNHDYTTDILPRLVILLGRSPVIGDVWFDGTRFKTYTGDAWIG